MPETHMTRQAAIAALTAVGQPYELTEEAIRGQLCRVFRNAPPSLRDLYSAARSDLPFIEYQAEQLSFEASWRAACKLAQHLHNEAGIHPGDRVALSMRNYPEWIISFMAVTSMGAVAVAMNALWQPDEMAYALNDSGAKALIADAERLQRVNQCNDLANDLKIYAVRCPEPPMPATDLTQLLATNDENSNDPQASQMPNTAPNADDDATILYTSGSTGHPKGAVSSHRNIITALMSWELEGQINAKCTGIEITEPERQPAVLLAVPLFHATGSHAVFLASYRAQRRIVSMYKWDVAEAARLIEAGHISNFVAPAAMTGDLVNYAAANGHDLSSLMMVGGGGAPRAPEQVHNIKRTFASAMPNTGWGMTETNAIGTGISGEDYLQRPASSGRVSAVLDLRIVAEDGTVLPANERGELQIRGTSIIRGYWQRPDANAETFVDGWLRTGDVAYLDEEGFLFIVDRIKDLVIRGGENIGCGAVEAALLEHPAVLEASVYGVPDERLGEEVGATVYAQGTVDEQDLRTFLGQRLAQFEVPRYLRFSPTPLPRIASGKIFKRELRSAAVAELEGT